MKLDWNNGALADGLRCFDRQEFFAAHEHWESVWLKCEEPQKSFLQALIQVASAFHHHQRSNLRGAASVLIRAVRTLELFPAHFEEIDVVAFRTAITTFSHSLESDSPNGFSVYPKLPVVVQPAHEQRKAD